MKTVFSNAMTAHVWAQQKQSVGRSSHGSIFFEGATIYSYGSHYPIATILTNGDNQLMVMNSDSYSMSTHKHCSYVRRAASHYNQIQAPTRIVKACIRAEKDNLNPIIQEIQHTIKNGLDSLNYCQFKRKARIEQFKSETIASTIYSVRQQAKILEFFGETLPKEVEARITELETDATSGLESYYAEVAEKNRLDAIHKAKLKAEKDAKIAQVMQRWINNEPIEWNEKSLIKYADKVAMRIKTDGENIETTQGAEFPIEHGKKAFEYILKCYRDKTEWQRNGKTIHLGHFQIDKIESNGNVKAGCHYVEFAEIARIATQLKLYP